MKAINISFLLLSYLSVSHGWQCKQGPQQAGAAQIDAGQGQVVMRDGNSDVYFLSGSTWSRLGSVALKHVSVGPAGIWGVDSSDTVHKYVAGDFIPSVGQNLQQVDAGGDGQVVGVTGSDTIHCLDSAKTSGFKDVGSLSWNTITGGLVYYSCSSHGCWGVNTNDNIYYTGISPETCAITGWIRVNGAAVMAEIGTDGTVFVVNAGGNLYQRTGISTSVPQGTGWTHIPMSENIKHATYDLGHLWLTTDAGAILECSR